MPVVITVASYPNRPFRGSVLRLGAEAIVDQNVTMFPVLIRIANDEGLLRPGMNAEVEVEIGDVRDAVAVPNAALRSVDEIGPAAAVGSPRPRTARFPVGDPDPFWKDAPFRGALFIAGSQLSFRHVLT